MAIYFPPDNLHGKMLKMWYREKARELTGYPNLPPNWAERVGFKVEAVRTISFINGKPYENWDMKDQLVRYPYLALRVEQH